MELLLKPGDIPKLQLDELHGVGTGSRPARFYAQVEAYTDGDGTRLVIAQNRMDNDIATIICFEINCGNIFSWLSCKKYRDMNFISISHPSMAWQLMGKETYDFSENSRAFINRM